MKKIVIMLLLFAIHVQSKAQITTDPASGHVGIGTTTPGQVLDVTGTGGAFSNTASANSIFVQDHTNYRGIYLGFDTSGQIGIVAPSTSGVPSSLAFWNHNGTSWFEAMRIASTGNVGIGIANPTGLLSLGTSIAHRKLILHDGGNALFGMGVQNNQFEQYINNGDANNHFSWGNLSIDGNFNFSELMRLSTTGNLGIGTTDNANWQLANSSYKLAVGGSVIAQAVTVKLQSAWPDYVFKPTYHLNPLSEIATYIDQNHHLPEMPSEKEIAKDGVNLGEMDKILTKKIEELTLYLIEKDKQLNQQQTLIQEQQKMIEQLNARMVALEKASAGNKVDH